jgi:serine/threonine protein kinase, bacterial
MPLVSGATAAGVNIVRLLGCGQIGELYLAEHPRLPRRYALKILSADVSTDPEYRYRFNQESDQAAALWHPNIVGIHDRGEFEDRLWLLMDYVDSTDAAQLLTDTYPEGMPPDMVLEIVAAIADALDYAHEQGLVHRYVNPSNILLSNSESARRRIVLAGFGVPRRPAETNSLTRRNLAIGTASYAAPEQLMDDSIDGRTDQYALASTAFHLLTGSAPFAHMNHAVVISKHLNETPPRPGDVKPELTYFDAPFARALMKAPNERFRQCRDFAKALEARGSLKLTIRNADAAQLLTVPESENGVPTEAPVPSPVTPSPPPVVPAPPPAEVGDAGAPPDVLSAAEVRDAVAPPDVLPETEADDAITLGGEPEVSDVWTATDDDTRKASHRHRLLHTAGLGLAILTVAVGGTLGVMALRSASESRDTPTDVETPSSVTTVPPARPAPATAISPPVVKAPAPTSAMITHPSATPPTVAPSPASTTAAPVTASSAPETTVAPTTRPHSPPPTTPTPPPSLDTRPAVGMPCGPAGATATSNSGIPVACADTPGGSAWEPSGG